MRKYKSIDKQRIVEIDDLSFLRERKHRYGWIRRHYHHFRHKRAFRKADIIIAEDESVALDVVRYYFVPKTKVLLRKASASKPAPQSPGSRH